MCEFTEWEGTAASLNLTIAMRSTPYTVAAKAPRTVEERIFRAA
jgi:hypothetical protein